MKSKIILYSSPIFLISSNIHVMNFNKYVLNAIKSRERSLATEQEGRANRDRK